MNFKDSYPKLLQFTEDLFNHPELGYKEFRTSQRVIDYLTEVNLSVEPETFARTGIKVNLTTDKAYTLAFIAELDAVYSPSHFNSDQGSGAAHNCGHFTQVAIALALYEYYIKTQAHLEYSYNLCFIFIPAEEYLDLDFRRDLRERGEITYLGGKPEAMSLGVFDDIDLALSVHSIGETFEEPTIEVNCDLAGFLYKYYTFEGKATHAGFDPFSGINAYNMSSLFNVALGLRRQQFIDTQSIRINPIVMDSHMSTNVIPNYIKLGTDLRAKTVDYMKEVAIHLDQIAEGSAMSLGGRVQIETEMGYLPFVQNRYLNSMVQDVFNLFPEIPGIIDDRGSIAAAGDIGDLSFMLPCAQISYSGFTGTIHGDDFNLVDPEFVLQTFPKFLVKVLAKYSEELDYSKLYKRSFAEYEALISTI